MVFQFMGRIRRGANDTNRLRLDDRELRDDIQDHCKALWPQLTNENLAELAGSVQGKAPEAVWFRRGRY